MPSWGEALAELGQRAQAAGGVIDVDALRSDYLTHLNTVTGRNVINYSTDYFGSAGPQTNITLTDMQGLMEVFRGLRGDELDLILHSPGGQAEATDSLVRYMRSKFKHVRVFVPLAAMSAATMWAMAADEIVMGKHSQLGPIDPQVTLPSGLTTPARALIDQFEEASQQLARSPERMAAWLPTLQQYPPGLLNICQSAADLAKQLVDDWLRRYMFHGDPDGDSKATQVADWLSDDKAHLSHSRAITREQLKDQGVNVTNLEDNEELQDAVLSVHHATMLTFQASPAVKIIENHQGKRYIQQGGQQIVMMPPGPTLPAPTPPI